MRINLNSKIYVACPASFATGGPELLHQLVYELVKLGFDAYMYYYNQEENKNPVHEAYHDYRNGFVDSIEDCRNNILIVPEVQTNLLYEYNNIQKVIWWLSVDNYYGFLRARLKINEVLLRALYSLKLYPRQNIYKFNKEEPILHLVQSEYARQMLKSYGIGKILYLSDYLNKGFIEQQLNNNSLKKENIVIYNPKKGLAFTKKLMKQAVNIKFVPVVNMTRQQVLKLLATAKVYIDFGNHPGKDRLPREAAISGCCVITGKRGSAKYYEDVMILDEFKFDESVNNITSIIGKINCCFENFEEESLKFNDYREKIKSEEREFIKDIVRIFKVQDGYQ